MRLPGHDFDNLIKILIDAFPTHQQLQALVRIELDSNLDSIAGIGGLEQVVFNLLGWAETNDRLEQLLAGALRRNPNNLALRAKYQELKQEALTSRNAGSHSPYVIDRPLIAPVPRFRLYGREDTLNTILTVLSGQKTVLVYGLAGVGKTALVQHLAKIAQTRFEGGVLWLDVGTSPLSALCDAIGRAFGSQTIMKLDPHDKLAEVTECVKYCETP